VADDLVPQDPDGLVARWLTHLFGGLHIPGAVKAISHLVTGAAEVPSAGFSWLSDRIKDDSFMRSDATKLIVAAASREAKRDPEFASRALAHQSRKLAQRQENREAVAAKAVALLQETPPPGGLMEEPTDDFLNFFGDHAERASSEELRDLFARILAGEIRKPQSFSLRTVQFLSIMDQELAAVITKASGWVSGDFIIQTKALTSGAGLEIPGLLVDVALVRNNLTLTVSSVGAGPSLIVIGAKAVALHWRMTGGSFQTPVLTLTPTGKEIMSIVPSEPDEDYLEAVATDLGEFGGQRGMLEKVTLANVIVDNTGHRFADYRTVWHAEAGG
jgi:Protein of unknown function (DUF2806)